MLTRSQLEAATELMSERDDIVRAIDGLKGEKVSRTYVTMLGPAPFKECHVELPPMARSGLLGILGGLKEDCERKLKELGVAP